MNYHNQEMRSVHWIPKMFDVTGIIMVEAEHPPPDPRDQVFLTISYPNQEYLPIGYHSNVIRWDAATRLANWLNGGPRPEWLNDADVICAGVAMWSDGMVVSVMGPFGQDWEQRPDGEAQESRCRFLQWLLRKVEC